MEQVEVAHWDSHDGGWTDIELQHGTYRVDGATVARITRTPGSPIQRFDLKGDGHFIETQDVPATETLEPLDAAGFTASETGEYRLTWPRGHIVLWQVSRRAKRARA